MQTAQQRATRGGWGRRGIAWPSYPAERRAGPVRHLFRGPDGRFHFEVIVPKTKRRRLPAKKKQL